jgi:hypothetical protein
LQGVNAEVLLFEKPRHFALQLGTVSYVKSPIHAEVYRSQARLEKIE